MEDMGAIDMDHDLRVGIALSIAVSGDMGAGVDHPDLVASLGKLAANDSAGQPGPNQKNAFRLHFAHP